MALLELNDKVYKIPKNVMKAFEDMSDYIEELEEKNKKLKEEYITLEKDYGTCEIENGKLRDRIKEENQHIFANVNDDELLRSNAMNWAEANKLQQRIDKAIEYIENMPYAEIPDDDYENNHKMVEWNDSDLLKILKGE